MSKMPESVSFKLMLKMDTKEIRLLCAIAKDLVVARDANARAMLLLSGLIAASEVLVVPAAAKKPHRARKAPARK